MPYKRGKVFNVSMNEDDKLLLETLAKRHKLPQKVIVGTLIAMCDKYNLMAGDWQARLQGVEQELNRYAGLEGSCPALTFADKFYVCVWGQDGKTPALKKLAKEIDEALEICGACTKTLKIKLDNESYQVKVQELEAKLKEKSSKKFKIPQCNNGGRLDSDGTAFDGCPRSPGKPVSIESYCKKLKDGAGCDWFKSRLVAVGTEVKNDF